MKLSTAQRGALLGRFGGRCAYCGSVLSGKWHADHVEPLKREGKWVGRPGHRGLVYVSTGEVRHPERDNIDNLLPACVPCNINKGPLTLEQWRKSLERLPEVLEKNYSAWRHAHRFGLVLHGRPQIEFHFETYIPPARPRVFLLE